jgi:hypothetical protein
MFIVSMFIPNYTEYTYLKFLVTYILFFDSYNKISLHLYFLCSDDKPCKNHIIAFSGFEGEERARIRFMIEAIGAKFTSYFTKHNHLLVCRKWVVLHIICRKILW